MSRSKRRAMAKMRAIWVDGVGVGVGAAADQVGALLAGRDQQFLGAGIVGQSLLREDADLEVERPGVVALEAAQHVKTLEADARVDLDVGAHELRAREDRLLQRAPRARLDVGFGEGGFGARGLGDRFLQRAFDDAAAVEDAGLVEVDVGFDEARQDGMAADVLDRRVAGGEDRARSRRCGRRECRYRQGRSRGRPDVRRAG